MRGLPRVMEATHRLELGRAVVLDEGAEEPARADSAELVGVTDVDELRVSLDDHPDESLQVVGSRHPRLIEDHDRARIEPGSFAGAIAVQVEQELR